MSCFYMYIVGADMPDSTSLYMYMYIYIYIWRAVLSCRPAIWRVAGDLFFYLFVFIVYIFVFLVLYVVFVVLFLLYALTWSSIVISQLFDQCRGFRVITKTYFQEHVSACASLRPCCSHCPCCSATGLEIEPPSSTRAA